ncbi:MAG: HD domain-containing protein [Spirochaetales bacterium]|nr:MAG: HD domain-containing protein [Spirochaetales bacterium]
MATRTDKLKKALEVDAILNKIQDLDVLLETILTEARGIINADAGSVYIREGDELEIRHSQNATKQAELEPGQKLPYSVFRIPIGDGTTSGYAAKSRKNVNVKNVYHIPPGSPYGFDPSYDAMSGYRTVSTLSIPLETNNEELLGVLQLINKKDVRGRVIPFSVSDEDILEHFAATSTMALQRAELLRELLIRMISMARHRDPKETGPHVNRVAGYALAIYERYANKKGFPKKVIEHQRDMFRMAAMLHDVGKVAIPDHLLKKPGPLDDEERTIMKTHTLAGAQLFAEIKTEFDDVARIVALNHHEDWDGSGYPGYVDVMTGKQLSTKPDGSPVEYRHDGTPYAKRGNEIPLFGQIVSIADVYDALRSKRAYKKAFSEKKTLETIRELANHKFNPELVDVFFEILPSINVISYRFAEQEKEDQTVAPAMNGDAFKEK